MKRNLSVALFLMTSSTYAATTAPNVSSWIAGTPVTHGLVKDQGDVGFCWANAWSSFVEAKILKDKGTSIDISPIYLGRAEMARVYVSTLGTMNQPSSEDNDPTNASLKKEILSRSALDILGKYKEAKKDPILSQLIKPYFTKKLQDYSADNEAFSFMESPQFGVVPSSVYEKQKYDITPLGPVSGMLPPFVNLYFAPEFEDFFNQFVENHLLNASDTDRYLGKNGVNELERDFDRDLGNQPISEEDSFVIEGKSYTPLTFLSSYVGINSSDLKGGSPMLFIPDLAEIMALQESEDTEAPRLKAGMAALEDFDKNVLAVQKELDKNHPVLLSMHILDDFETNPNFFMNGVLDPFYCEVPGKCKDEGGHAVLIVNTMKDADGNIMAFIIQNSWGPMGVTEKGAKSRVRADRGFFIVTMDYLRASISEKRPFAFTYEFI